MAILWMVPIYSITSWLSLVFPLAQPYLSVIRDCYEAYVVYTFIAFLKSALGEDEDGNPQNVIEVLAKQFQTPPSPGDGPCPPSTASSTQQQQQPLGSETELTEESHSHSLRGEESSPAESEEIDRSSERDLEKGQDHPQVTSPPSAPVAVAGNHLQKAPCPCCIPSQVRKSSTGIADATLHQCEVMAMQFVFFKPLLATAPFFFQLCGYDYEGHPPIANGAVDWLSARLYVLVLGNLSVSIAFYGLLCFFHLTEKDLAWCKPWPKFLCVKGVVFMTFWQDILLQCMSGSGVVDARSAGQIQNLLICIEMFMASIAHFYIFPYEEWDSKKRKQASLEVRDTMAFYAFLSDFKRVIKGNPQPHHKLIEDIGTPGQQSFQSDFAKPSPSPCHEPQSLSSTPLRYPPAHHPSPEREAATPSPRENKFKTDQTPLASSRSPESTTPRRSPQVVVVRDYSDSDSDSGTGTGGGDKGIQSV
jgi:hypothetical protein